MDIKYNLRNVLCICGTDCKGKTILSKLPVSKYYFNLYGLH